MKTDEKIQQVAENYYNEKSEKNFNILAVEIMPVIRNVAMKVMRDKEKCEDVVQESLLRIYRNKTFVYDPLKPYLGYVSRVAYTTALNLYNRKYVMESDIIADDIANTAMESVMDHHIENLEFFGDDKNVVIETIMDMLKDDPIIMDAILSNLSSDDIEELNAKYGTNFEPTEKTYKDICEKYNISHGALKTRVHRKKKNLKKLSENGIIKLDGVDVVKNGKTTIIKRYYESGEVKSIIEINGDVKNSKFFYKNGNVKLEGVEISGNKVGDWIGYDEACNVISVYTYDDDIIFYKDEETEGVL